MRLTTLSNLRVSLFRSVLNGLNLLAQCLHHGLERCRLCQIIYEGLDQATRTMVESMCRGFLNKSETEAWNVLEELVKKILQWETSRDESLSARINSQKA